MCGGFIIQATADSVVTNGEAQRFLCTKLESFEEKRAVKLLARVEQEIDKVDGDDNDERLGLFDSDKKV